jgi:predicted phage gp36 major capsid-like protein
MLACGFVYAVRQQVLAVDYGYKAEALRREREELLDEQRRLLLAVEENSSPAQLERAGLELGLRPARSSQIGGAATASAARSEQPHAGVFVGTAAGAGGVLRR